MPFTSSAPADPKTGISQPFVSASGNVWVIQFGPYQTKRDLNRIAIIPPSAAAGSTRLSLFLETTLIANAPSGIATNFAPIRVIPFPAGTSLFLVWFINGGTPPEATLFSDQEWL